MAFMLHSLFHGCIFFSLALAFATPRALCASAKSNQNWHVISVQSLLPSAVCTSPSPRASNYATLNVVHRHGPCSPLAHDGKPSHVEILNQDQSRVDSIHRKIAAASKSENVRASLGVSVPARAGISIGTGNYIVSVGIGTPAKEFSLIFDTGSDVSWIQCKPCAKCYAQQDPLFDPTQSSTYSSISCGAPECQELFLPSCSKDKKCRYKVTYGDRSHTYGNLGRDTLTLTSSDTLPNFVFGCGDDNGGLFGRADGLIGLGREEGSLASQASRKYGAVFSYCLPSTSSGTGYLTLGGTAPANAQYTQISRTDTPYYYLNLVGIKVGGQLLSISPTVFARAGTIIDSGTVITRLPPAAYSVLRSAFNQQMTRYPRAPPVSIFDTCYDFTGYSTIQFPAVALVFAGAATLDVDASGILYVEKVSQVCLAFAGNPYADSAGILGNKQQKTFAVIYDASNQRIGFGAKGCS